MAWLDKHLILLDWRVNWKIKNPTYCCELVIQLLLSSFPVSEHLF